VNPALVSEFLKVLKQAPRLYFTPLIGAMNGVRSEYRRLAILDREDGIQRKQGVKDN
jgi:hypothetical protein